MQPCQTRRNRRDRHPIPPLFPGYPARRLSCQFKNFKKYIFLITFNLIIPRDGRSYVKSKISGGEGAPMFDIAIIGAGATAISLLKHLEDICYNDNFKKPQVALIRPARYFGTGKAFGDTDGHYRVNTPPKMLAISDYEPHNFSKFLLRTAGSHLLYPVR